MICDQDVFTGVMPTGYFLRKVANILFRDSILLDEVEKPNGYRLFFISSICISA